MVVDGTDLVGSKPTGIAERLKPPLCAVLALHRGQCEIVRNAGGS